MSTLGLVGRKCGMSRQFTEAGDSIPVTVILLEPNHVVQIKTQETDGYSALQLTTGTKRKSRLSKAAIGHFAKAKVEAGRGLWEFKFDSDAAMNEYALGQAITADYFQAGQKVDVTGVTRGKGFAGCVKRHHFRTQDASHGNSRSHRAPGSIGQNQSPRKVFKNKKMAGHLGNVQRTVQSQEIVRVDCEKNIIFVKGVVPGAPGSDVIIFPAVKYSNKQDK